MSKIVILMVSTLFLFAENLEILSKSFNYDEKARISTFTDDVNVTKGKDNVLCDKLNIYFDENKTAEKIVAINNVHFVLNIDNNSTYKGQSNHLIYLVKDDKIFLDGNVSINKIEEEQKLYGEHIIIDKKNKKAQVIGDKKPIKFIIKVKD